MNKKDIRLAMDDSYDTEHEAASENGEILEATVGQLLESEEGSEGGSIELESPASRAALNGAGRRSKEKEIEALLERMVFSEQAFLEFPN